MALCACRKRQSLETGLIEDLSENCPGRIPLYENFCFVLALLRSGSAENVQEANALLERLLFSECTEDFFTFLAKDRSYLPLQWIFNEYQTLIGGAAQKKLSGLLIPIQKERGRIDSLSSDEELAALLIETSVQDKENFPALLKQIAAQWNSTLQIRIKDAELYTYERGQPKVSLLDYLMGQYFGSYSARALQESSLHTQLALVPFFEKREAEAPSFHFSCAKEMVLFFGDGEKVHSLSSPQQLVNKGGELFFDFPAPIPTEDQEGIELSFFCTVHERTRIFVNGKRATTFQLGDHLTICSEKFSIQLSFELIRGEGSFFGHIWRGVRPRERSRKGEERFMTYDWHIFLRTIHRKEGCRVRIFTAFI